MSGSSKSWPEPGASASDSASASPLNEMRDRLAFLRLEPADGERLRGMQALFAAHEADFVREFYEHLFSFPVTAQFLQNPERVERLKQMQQQHFRTLLEARWDEDYSAGRHRVGDVHADVGIEPQFFLGAYSKYLEHCLAHLLSSDDLTGGRDAQSLVSLIKAVFLDIGLTLDSYFERSTLNLRHALDMLWRANTELRQFAQLTTHDLKTPLATMANLCDEALDEFGLEMPDESRKLIQRARDSAFRMSSMIDELLATISAAPSVEEQHEVDLERIVAEVLELCRAQLVAKKVKVSLPGMWPKVWGNPVRLREALFNLVSNAAKFIERANGRIEIRIDETPTHVRISIRDNGPGIPATELTRIFVPYRRLPEHRSQPGFGLGLYFTKNLVEAQGGRVWAESEVGAGSTFHVELSRPPTYPAGKGGKFLPLPGQPKA